MIGKLRTDHSHVSQPRRTPFANEDLDAVGCFLQYLYTGEYFPKKIGDALESDSAQPMMGDDGEQLLKHAKVYTLAHKLGVMVSCSTPFLLPSFMPTMHLRSSNPSRTRKSTALTRPPAASSPTRVSCTQILPAPTPRSVSRSRRFGASAVMCCGTRPKMISGHCVWSIRSLGSTC